MESSNKLTKAEIVDALYEDLDINRSDIHSIINKLFDHLKTALSNEQVIELRGFGTFEIRSRKKREKARNPKTGETVTVDAHGVVMFRPGKQLKKIAWNLRD